MSATVRIASRACITCEHCDYNAFRTTHPCSHHDIEINTHHTCDDWKIRYSQDMQPTIQISVSFQCVCGESVSFTEEKRQLRAPQTYRNGTVFELAFDCMCGEQYRSKATPEIWKAPTKDK